MDAEVEELKKRWEWIISTVRQWLEEIESVKKVWNSVWVGVPLWIVFARLWLHWNKKPPAPGYAIGVLAVVAGIMSVREGIKTLGKISWVVLLIGLLITEFRAIDNDRAVNEQKQGEFFAAQKKGFDSTAAGLTAAINGLNITIAQTQPYAFIAFDGIRSSIVTYQGIPVSIVQTLSAKSPIGYNALYRDTGTASALPF